MVKLIHKKKWHTAINFFIAAIWLVNGLFCKILNWTPRHQEIIARILGEENSKLYTLTIGVLEVLMAIWIVSRIQPKINAASQIVLIGSMNVIEFILVPDLLLWGRINILYALVFMVLIFFNEFFLGQKDNFKK